MGQLYRGSIPALLVTTAYHPTGLPLHGSGKEWGHLNPDFFVANLIWAVGHLPHRLTLKAPKVRKFSVATRRGYPYICDMTQRRLPKLRVTKAAEVHTLAAAFFCRAWNRNLASKCLQSLLTAFCKVANSLQN